MSTEELITIQEFAERYRVGTETVRSWVREGLIDYAKKLSPGKIILVHGDPPAVEWMRATLSAALPRSEVIVPAPGMELEF